jgi:hypothetical protein
MHSITVDMYVVSIFTGRCVRLVTYDGKQLKIIIIIIIMTVI